MKRKIQIIINKCGCILPKQLYIFHKLALFEILEISLKSSILWIDNH